MLRDRCCRYPLPWLADRQSEEGSKWDVSPPRSVGSRYRDRILREALMFLAFTVVSPQGRTRRRIVKMCREKAGDISFYPDTLLGPTITSPACFWLDHRSRARPTFIRSLAFLDCFHLYLNLISSATAWSICSFWPLLILKQPPKKPGNAPDCNCPQANFLTAQCKLL